MPVRQALKAKRKIALSPENESKISVNLANFVLKSHLKSWGLVWPLAHEIDLRPLCHFLYQKQFKIFLPETFKAEKKILFRKWTPEILMKKGDFGTFYPDETVDSSLSLEGVVVPLLGYDSKGYRIGYGGGFYDRFLAKYPKIFRLGYALSVQYKETLEIKKHDQRLDVLCTEKGIVTFPFRDPL
ncbi:5-formyltetrahydrofolate cyclo-ligase [Acetobacteraceae bacterium]|nr:5-formyltetrahydrofolate cyclo-ligase [Acetobacteraceae bacterium]